MTDTNPQFPPERQNAHMVAERIRLFFERLDKDRASTGTESAPNSGHGVSALGA